MSGYFALDPRPLAPEDAQSARAVLIGALGVTPYVDRAMEVLELAERGYSEEYQARIIARDGTVAALALFGPISGTRGGFRLHAVAVAPSVAGSDVGTRLLDAIADASRAEGGRFLLAEMPDDAAIGSVISLLRASGFSEEARVPDFFRDGIALTFLRRSL